MKFTLLTLMLFVLGAVTISAASFPVERTAVETSSIEVQETVETKTEVVALPFNPAAGKSQLIALLLAGFVGALGIHRFYLGYTWQGVVQLLTLGACGIWSLIDLIRIITGDLQPKNGSYSKTL